MAVGRKGLKLLIHGKAILNKNTKITPYKRKGFLN